ncbi:hypothetical protein Agub_g9214 [Astrephomene gubernaculifera]|uniref:Response regulatory domain-containing protein n=1 Tax=Astrephomene gubernaculifera TaxID=47775 RepID=A0AAD3DSZ3_9CHLO|nr:hypothetical protein Agub_g9214 [Astrephomene gubernaculifera]
MSVDLHSLPQLPGLAHRPNFPRDLRVLLVDADYKARQEAEAQLREYHYTVTHCSSSVEAAAHLANGESSCDVVLADVRCLQQKSAEHAAVVQAAKTIPLILMSESGTPNEVMLGIKLGAVDFLEKPLSPLKLKNIWQHFVRRLLSANACGPSHHKKCIAASATASPEISGSHGGGCGSHSHGYGGESGSNASTSEQLPVKLDFDADIETSSFQEAMGCMDALTMQVANHTSTGTMDADCALLGCTAAAPACISPAMQLDTPCCKPRPQPLKYKVGRGSAPGIMNGSGGSSSGSGSGSGSGGLYPKPCIGYPAGRLPPLPAGVPGIEWGLPTNPLQISPKAPPMPPMLPPMCCPCPCPWPGGSLMLSSPPPLFPLMLGSPSPSVASGCCSALPLSSSCLTLSSIADTVVATAPLPPPMRRSDSDPLPAASGCFSSGSAATATATAALGGNVGAAGGMTPPTALSAEGMAFMQPCSVRGLAAADAGDADPACGSGTVSGDMWACGVDPDSSPFQPPVGLPPIGLQLKKSPSLADLISESLRQGVDLSVF